MRNKVEAALLSSFQPFWAIVNKTLENCPGNPLQSWSYESVYALNGMAGETQSAVHPLVQLDDLTL